MIYCEVRTKSAAHLADTEKKWRQLSNVVDLQNDDQRMLTT